MNTLTPDVTTYRLVAVDLYRDIHKGIRSELCGLVEAAGSADPGSRDDRIALQNHVSSIAAVLESHAHHEDDAILPTLERELPDLAERIARDHEDLEQQFARVVDEADSFALGTPDRRAAQLLYLDVARFVSDYLVHIDVEERDLMPRLDDAIGTDAVADIHGRIIAAIPPDEMLRTLSFMLPAMNTDDRVELLGAMRDGAPPEAFTAVVDLAHSVLRPAAFTGLAERLELR